MTAIRIAKYDTLNIQFECDDIAVLRTLQEAFTDYAPGFVWSPRFKSGLWDGKISVFDWYHKALPYGLLLDAVRVLKRDFPELPIKINPDVLTMFNGTPIPIDYNLRLAPRNYQADCIEAALKHSKGVIVSSTASGKSAVMAYIIKHLVDNTLSTKTLVIVPTIQLVDQFCSDLKDYGITYSIGKVWSKAKEWDKQIVVSTWQSISSALKNREGHRLQLFDCVLCDECHGVKALEIRNILQNCTRATYRLGFTGTLPTSKLDLWQIKAYLGPVLREYGPGELSELGFISKCNVNIYNVEYNREFTGTYGEIQDAVFTSSFRLNLIERLLSNIDGNVLMLVGKVEKEGVFLKEHLSKCPSLKDRKILFLYGHTPKDEREYWRKEMEHRTNIILIATYQIFSTGTNIPSLKHLILASPYKSKIRVLQSVGRTLRLHASKTLDGAYVYDIVDQTKYFADSGEKRRRYYNSEGFNINETEVKE